MKPRIELVRIPARIQCETQRATWGLEARMTTDLVTLEVSFAKFETKVFFCDSHGDSLGAFKHPRG